jgi:hypothetical protein
MNGAYVILRHGFRTAVALFILGTGPAAVRADEFIFPTPGSPPFDFADTYYQENGINPPLITDRVNGHDGISVIDEAPDERHDNVRVIETTAGYDSSGSFLSYNIMGTLFKGSFTPDSWGVSAHETANKFRAFLFPKRSAGQLCPAPSCRRQDNVFDTTMGYLSNNPLGLWRITFVSYTHAALTTVKGKAALAQLARRNGTDLDGTPVIKRLSEINELERNGFVLLRQRNEDGSDGFPWVI